MGHTTNRVVAQWDTPQIGRLHSGIKVCSQWDIPQIWWLHSGIKVCSHWDTPQIGLQAMVTVASRFVVIGTHHE